MLCARHFKNYSSKKRIRFSKYHNDALIRFENVNSNKNNNNKNIEFGVLTYNILTQKYTKVYPYCKPENLELPERRRKIFLEIEQSEADICCFQELDQTEFNFYYSSFMSEKKYYGLFETGLKSAPLNDIHGLGTFFNTDRFSLVDSVPIRYNEAIENIIPTIYGEKFLKTFRTLSNVGLICLLKVKGSDRFLCIVNTHLYWSPEHNATRIIQSHLLIQQLNKLKQKYSKLAIIITGDFNSHPRSSNYSYLSTGIIKCNDGAFKEKDVLFDSSKLENFSLKHGLDLGSAYGDTVGEPLYTNITETFKETLDYIWYSKNSLIPTSVKKTLTVEEATKETALPNSEYPSDHIPLYSSFSLI